TTIQQRQRQTIIVHVSLWYPCPSAQLVTRPNLFGRGVGLVSGVVARREPDCFCFEPRSFHNLYQTPSSGTGSEAVLFKSMEWKYPIYWSADGRFIAYQVAAAKTGMDIWVLPLFGERKTFPLLQTAFNEEHLQFSPDGRWLAYTSDESGRPKIYVQSFPASGS